MHLEGWTNPLPSWLTEWIITGDIKVNQAKGFQYLTGRAINPQGTIISFN